MLDLKGISCNELHAKKTMRGKFFSPIWARSVRMGTYALNSGFGGRYSWINGDFQMLDNCSDQGSDTLWKHFEARCSAPRRRNSVVFPSFKAQPAEILMRGLAPLGVVSLISSTFHIGYRSRCAWTNRMENSPRMAREALLRRANVPIDSRGRGG